MVYLGFSELISTTPDCNDRLMKFAKSFVNEIECNENVIQQSIIIWALHLVLHVLRPF